MTKKTKKEKIDFIKSQIPVIEVGVPKGVGLTLSKLLLAFTASKVDENSPDETVNTIYNSVVDLTLLIKGDNGKAS